MFFFYRKKTFSFSDEIFIILFFKYRIANALFGLTPGMGADAQRQLSEGAKARSD
jgi:hypothetical protein